MASPETNELELELTYLAREIPAEISGVSPTTLTDVYLPADLNVHSRLRLRQKGDRYEITKKTPIEDGDASAHLEQTIPLDANEFEALAPASDKRVEKDRYFVEIDGKSAEVDVFRGILKGLVAIDFEFNSEEEKDAFVAPAVCLADITQEDFIAGGNLAGRSYEDIELELDRFNYKAL